MLFNSVSEIKNDILDKISNYLMECVQTNTPIDRKNILSLIRTYFHELEIRNIIYLHDVEISGNEIHMNFYFDQQEVSFSVDLFNHVRKMKIDKIYKNIIENFLV